VARRMGKIVICGATTGHALSFDARYLWMHQKQILGSHGCNSHDAGRANALVESGVVNPTLTKTYGFHEAALAHQELLAGSRTGSLSLMVE
jgi:crotonyl-CoA carboxylase/reductase